MAMVLEAPSNPYSAEPFRRNKGYLSNTTTDDVDWAISADGFPLTAPEKARQSER